ncbi:hypothetical protein [Nocardioides aquiterrae]|uniref:Tissue inhibitor of metalloproteinase n=1 Tax=Nocardioides aquiterrae TaxID=203799 RepID=A0ABN1UMJ8_9ACTN
MSSLRTRLAGLLAGLLAAFGLVALTPAAAHACSCVQDSPRQHAKGADVVFTGTLTRIDPPPWRPIMSSGDPATYHFDVDGVLKGDVPSNARVTSAVSGASCGLEGMAVDRRYVVYATGAHELSANLCGGTAEVGPATVERVEKVMGPAHDPGPAAAYPADDGAPVGWILAGAAGLVAAAAALAVRRRGRRTSHA